jgi:hypothetical protein
MLFAYIVNWKEIYDLPELNYVAYIILQNRKAARQGS